MKRYIFSIILFFIYTATVPLVSTQWNNYEVYYEWKQVDYTFPNDSVRNELIQNGGFVPINCAPTGIKISGDMVFVATPRYRNGVPSALNVIPYKKSIVDQFFKRNQGPKLTPFPSWEMQQVGNCTALQLVQAMELDNYNRLWIVDAGRTEVLTEAPKNLCPAKLVIYDLNSNKIDRIYQFPSKVLPPDTSIIKDIQVACTSRDDCHSYISNLNVTCTLTVYDYKNNDSWYATHSSMQPDLSRANVTIEGVTATVPFGQTGLGLTPRTTTNYSTLYYSKIAGDHIYSVATSYLKDSTTLKQNPTLPDNAVQDLGAKPMGQADGTAMDNRGRWYFGSLPESAVYSIDTNGNPNQLPRASRAVQSSKDMQWPDTFSFDGQGNLLFTSTRFQLFAEMMVNPQEVNYRLIRFKTNSLPYSA